MHMKPAALVFADSEGEAVEMARGVFRQLCLNQEPFDYFELMQMDGETGNWKEGEVAYKQDSPEFSKIVTKRMEYTKLEFMRYLKDIRRALKSKTDEQLFAARFGDVKVGKKTVMFRYSCGILGQYHGSGIWLYDQDGEGIREPGHLKDVEDKWPDIHEEVGKPNPYAGKKLWAVVADVHF